jgi:hypothetical protein
MRTTPSSETCLRRLEDGLALLRSGVDEVAYQEYDREATSQVELLDARTDVLCSVYVREHLLRLVDRDDSMSQSGERVRYPTHSASELEHLGAGSYRAVNSLGLAECGEETAEIDRASVRGGAVHDEFVMKRGG